MWTWAADGSGSDLHPLAHFVISSLQLSSYAFSVS